MQLIDRWGLSTTAPDQDALDRYEHLLDGYVTFAADLAPGRLQGALAGDPAPMAQILYGHFMTSAHTEEGWSAARSTHEALAERRSSLNEREQAHLDALSAAVVGDVQATNDVWCAIVERWPTDMAALRLSHFSLFNRGDLGRMEATVARAREHWSDDLPRASYLGGMRAFALEELGRYDEAEPLGKEAVALDGTDLWSIHAIAHVLEMQQRIDDGIEWLSGRDDVLDAKGSFAGHVWWHHALHLVEQGRYDDALHLFDRGVLPAPSTEGLTLTNSVALLARIDFAGGDVGGRWSTLTEAMALRLGVHSHPFNDCHYILGAGLAGDLATAEALVAGMTEWADTHDDDAAEVLRHGGLDTAKGLLAFGRGDGATAERHLEAGHTDRWRLGGSHAQRDIFEQARLAAAVRYGDPAVARRLAEERAATKPGSPAAARLLAGLTAP